MEEWRAHRLLPSVQLAPVSETSGPFSLFDWHFTERTSGIGESPLAKLCSGNLIQADKSRSSRPEESNPQLTFTWVCSYKDVDVDANLLSCHLCFWKRCLIFHRFNAHGLVLLDTLKVNGELSKWDTDMQPSSGNLKCCLKVESKQSDYTSESRVSQSNGALPLSPCQVEVRPHKTLIYFYNPPFNFAFVDVESFNRQGQTMIIHLMEVREQISLFSTWQRCEKIKP